MEGEEAEVSAANFFRSRASKKRDVGVEKDKQVYALLFSFLDGKC